MCTREHSPRFTTCWATKQTSEENLQRHSLTSGRKEDHRPEKTRRYTERTRERTSKTQRSRREETGKIRTKINETERKKMIEKTQWNWKWFFQKINKNDKLLARLIKKKRKWAQTDEEINEKEDTADTLEIKRIIRDYYKQLQTTCQ